MVLHTLSMRLKRFLAFQNARRGVHSACKNGSIVVNGSVHTKPVCVHVKTMLLNAAFLLSVEQKTWHLDTACSQLWCEINLTRVTRNHLCHIHVQTATHKFRQETKTTLTPIFVLPRVGNFIFCLCPDMYPPPPDKIKLFLRFRFVSDVRDFRRV